MDQRQLAELRRWATSLQESSPNEELRAAGKAILMLTEEIAQLRIRLDAHVPAIEEPAVVPAALEEEPEQGARAWFRRTLGMGHEDDVLDDDEEEEAP